MHHLCLSAQLTLPDWLAALAASSVFYKDAESQARLAVELSAENVARRSGGPFGAAVFEQESGRLIAVGVNQVVPLGLSIAHAEIMALTLAQKRLGTARLNQDGKRYVLATSAQPCAMCFGALPWAGIDVLIVSARREDVESLTGFEEGPVTEQWQEALEQRGIAVIRDVQRDEACKVLQNYAAGMGTLY